MLDQILGEANFVNEIIWKRQSAHNDAKQGSKHLGRVHDSIFLYAGGDEYTFNHAYKPYDQSYIDDFYKHVEPDTGRRYSLGDLGAPGGAAPSKGNPHYEFLGVTRYWRFSKERMQELYEKGEIVQSKPGSVPRQKRYLDIGKGTPVGTVWDDINPVQGDESLGYPTQKPSLLLNRILEISSNPNDIVLDAFCGCGTALVAAQNLGRQWIGIDISPTACRVMAKRLRDVCSMKESEPLWKAHRTDAFVVRDLPWTIDKLKALPHFEFENWAVIALGGIPNKVQVGDMGIDGRIYPVGTKPAEHAAKGKKGETDHMFADDWFPIQVKQVEKVGRPDIDQFCHAMDRENRQRGFFVSFGYSSDAAQECNAFHKRTGRIIKLLTVQEILDEEFVQKM